MKNSDLIYIAGFMDGEGSVGIYRQNTKESNNSYYLSVSIAQKRSKQSEKVLKMLTKIGGVSYDWMTKSNTLMWKWQITRTDAGSFLKDIIPFLIIKQDQARVCLNWQKSKKWLKPGPVPKKMNSKLKLWIEETKATEQILKRMKRG